MDNAGMAAPGMDVAGTLSAAVSVLLLGDAHESEMAPIAAHVKAVAPHDTRVASDVQAACDIIRGDHWHPDLIVALQAWSDQFSSADVLKLLALAPLARIVCAAGAWCDSDSRTRSSWPIAARIRVVDAPRRIDREVALLRSATEELKEVLPAAVSVLPLTASRAEVFGADMTEGLGASIDGARINVRSPDRAWMRMIETAVGIRSLSQRPPTRPTSVVIVDVDPWEEDQPELLRSAKGVWRDARVIACTGVATIDFREELLKNGADAVWFKLSPLTSLKKLITSSLEPPA